MSYKKEYTNEERDEWLSTIYPEWRGRNWHNNLVLLPLDKNQYKPLKPVKRIINPKDIIGIEYDDYYNDDKDITWLDLFHELKRLKYFIRDNSTKEQLCDVIHNAPEGKFAYKFGGKYYTTGGQHRLCLAKFLELEEVEVKVFEYVKINNETANNNHLSSEKEKHNAQSFIGSLLRFFREKIFSNER